MKIVNSTGKELYSLLGDLPELDRPISSRSIYTEEKDGYILEKLILDLNGEEDVPAYFVKPMGARKPPIVLFCHSHGGKYRLGKDELINGNSYLASPYAVSLTRRGYAALCVDAWLFGERSGREELDFAKEMIWTGKSAWGMMVYDQLRAIDYLFTREDADASRLAALGMSMGSTMSWWLAALDERVKVCVDICGLTDMHTLIKLKGLKHHGIYYYVPGLAKHFTTSQINALTAPRPHLSLTGEFDRLVPPEGADIIDKALKEAYERAGAPDAWRIKKFPVGHEESEEMHIEAMKFLEKWL